MTHGHGLRRVPAGGNGDTGWREVKGEKREYYNNIINKIYLEKGESRDTENEKL